MKQPQNVGKPTAFQFYDDSHMRSLLNHLLKAYFHVVCLFSFLSSLLSHAQVNINMHCILFFLKENDAQIWERGDEISLPFSSENAKK